MRELFNPFQPTITQSGLLNFGISLQSRIPCAVLTGVVHSYLQIKVDKATPYPVLADGTQSIFISKQGAFIGGAQTKIHEMQILAAGEYVGIRFHGGQLRNFFNVDLSEITDQFVDSFYFPCEHFSNLHQAIYRTNHFHDRVRLCETWLLQHYQPQIPSRFEQALALIHQCYGNVRVNALAKQVGWSSRHLNRIFQLHTGLSSKNFSSIIRMQHTCKQLYANPERSLAHSDLALGFCDQSHLIKEFRKQLLSKPSTFLERFRSDLYNQ